MANVIAFCHTTLDGYACGPHGDLMIFGSPHLVHVLAGSGLVDEFLIYQNPVTLGAGVPLMPPGQAMKLDLLASQPFQADVLRLQYRVKP